MSAYNVVRMDFVNGQSQYRFYKTPVTSKDYLYGEQSKIESDRLDEKIKNHVVTPFDVCADIVEEIKDYSPVELALRQQRSIMSSVHRTKNMVYNYSRGNVWEWFITLTFNKEKIDRYNFELCSKTVRKWLKNVKYKYASEMKYILVPEQHKDGAWHFHGLLSHCGAMKFNRAFNKYTGELLFSKSGLPIYNFGNYKLGFSSATPILDTAKASSYITKYITKELAINTKGFRRYYPSANLELPKKSYYFIADNEKLDFLKEMKDKITFNKEVKVKCGSYEQLVEYIEIGEN